VLGLATKFVELGETMRANILPPRKPAPTMEQLIAAHPENEEFIRKLFAMSKRDSRKFKEPSDEGDGPTHEEDEDE
jgi:hypothetical protein